MTIKTKKTVYIGMIFVSLVLFVGLILIAIFESEIREILTTLGFIVIGYASIIMFSYAWLKLIKMIRH